MTKNKDKIIKIVLIIYILGVMFFTFVVRETLVPRTFGHRGAELRPFREYYSLFRYQNHFFWFKQIALNILLFVPLGVLLPVKDERFKKLWKTALAGLLFSSFIEITQYITGRGFTETDDVINNTLGAVVGYLIFTFIKNRIRQAPK